MKTVNFCFYDNNGDVKKIKCTPKRALQRYALYNVRLMEHKDKVVLASDEAYLRKDIDITFKILWGLCWIEST